MSTFYRLTLRNKKPAIVNHNGVEVSSVAFWAYRKGFLDRLDSLVDKFQIAKLLTEDYKERFKENWLEEIDDKERNRKFGQFCGPIMELIVADYLSQNGESITKLAALNTDCRGDIESLVSKTKNHFFSEVKLFGEIPELYQLNLLAARSGKNFVSGSISPPGKIYNYIVYKIALAVSQLKDKNIDVTSRRVFLVFLSLNHIIIKMLNELKKENEWFKGENWEELCKELSLNQKQKQYCNTPVKEIIANTGQLIIGSLNRNWKFKIADIDGVVKKLAY